MEMNDTVAGVLIGGVLTAIGFIYQRRLDSLKVLNKNLFQLLTLYRSVNRARIDPSVVTDIVLEVLVEVFPGAKNDPSMKNVEKQYASMLSSIFEDAFRPEEDELLPLYLDAVNSLSSVDPVLAYRLSANVALKRYLVSADEHTKKIRESASLHLSESDMRIVAELHREASIELTKDVIRELKIDLLILSLRCGVIPLFSVARRLLRSQDLTRSEVRKMKFQVKELFEAGIKLQQAET